MPKKERPDSQNPENLIGDASRFRKEGVEPPKPRKPELVEAERELGAALDERKLHARDLQIAQATFDEAREAVREYWRRHPGTSQEPELLAELESKAREAQEKMRLLKIEQAPSLRALRKRISQLQTKIHMLAAPELPAEDE